MKFKLDENIPRRAAVRLKALGHDVHTVLDEGLGGASDPQVWDAAQSEQRFFITQDLDFSDARRFTPGTHHGVLLVRLEDVDQPQIAEFLEGWLGVVPAEAWVGACIVATSRKVRVMRPGGSAERLAGD